MNITEVLKCQFCGDSCGEEVCYNCQETADEFGVDIDTLYDMI